MIYGISVTVLQEIKDHRGAVLHMLRNDSEGFTQFGECYFSEVLPGAVKAWKRHKVQTQNIAVPIGRIRLVAYDNRQLSETKGNLLIMELGRPDEYKRVVIPPNVWYGFACISSEPALLVNCADYPHSPNESETLDIRDHNIPFSWGE